MKFKKGDHIMKAGGKYPTDAIEVLRIGDDGLVRASHIGGGFVFIVSQKDLDESHVVTDEEKNKPRWRRGWFELDEGPAYEGWTQDDRRNGWAVPFFEKDVADKIAKACNLLWDGEKDLYYGDPMITAYQDASEKFEAESIMVEGDLKTVFGIGAGGWTWTEVEKPNPRFVWNIGAIREEYADMPGAYHGLVQLWDRQEKLPVVTISKQYANAFCLETTHSGSPLTDLEKWLNSMSCEELESEKIPGTKPPFTIGNYE